jgi:hypothetical protein
MWMELVEENEYMVFWLGNLKEHLGEDRRIILKMVLEK